MQKPCNDKDEKLAVASMNDLSHNNIDRRAHLHRLCRTYRDHFSFRPDGKRKVAYAEEFILVEVLS